MKRKNEEVTFKDIFDVFKPKVWIIALVAVVCSAVLGIYSAVMKADTYTSSTEMLVTNDTQTATNLILAETIIPLYAELLSSDTILNAVIAELPPEYASYNVSASFLRRALSFSSKGNGILNISVTTRNKDLSFQLAEAFQNVAYREILKILPGALLLTEVAPPKIPSMPNSKNEVRNALIGFVGGAVVAAVAIWVIHAFDPIIRNKKKIEDYFDIPVLGVIPKQNVKVTEEASSNAVQEK
jgi:capsular polysaccharide biosynthesis protein